MARRILEVLAVVLLALWAGYWWGSSATNNAWSARQLEKDRQAAIELEQAHQHADAAASAYLTEHLTQESRYAQLDQRYAELRKRAPLVVAAPISSSTCNSSLVQEPDVSDSTAAPAAEPAGPVLTLAAVRMWNGALTGSDEPAGACGAADPAISTDHACSQTAGLSLDDAWNNHALNAQSCAADRLRYQRLIDYLNGK